MNHDMKYEKRKMCILKTIRRDFILSFAKLSWHPKYILNIFLFYDIEYNAWIWTSLDRHIRSGIFEKDFDNTCFVHVLNRFCTCFVHVLYMFCTCFVMFWHIEFVTWKRIVNLCIYLNTWISKCGGVEKLAYYIKGLSIFLLFRFGLPPPL